MAVGVIEEAYSKTIPGVSLMSPTLLDEEEHLRSRYHQLAFSVRDEHSKTEQSSDHEHTLRGASHRRNQVDRFHVVPLGQFVTS
jgi:hypothetical protein